MLGVLAAAAVACLLGVLDPPEANLTPGVGGELLDLVRVSTTTALAIALLLGPGLLWRTRGRTLRLAFMPLPGLALLILAAGLAWIAAPGVDPTLVCFVVLAPVLVLMPVALLRCGPGDLLDREEQRVLLFVSL